MMVVEEGRCSQQEEAEQVARSKAAVVEGRLLVSWEEAVEVRLLVKHRFVEAEEGGLGHEQEVVVGRESLGMEEEHQISHLSFPALLASSSLAEAEELGSLQLSEGARASEGLDVRTFQHRAREEER